MQRWEVLQAQAVERQRQSGQVRELQRQVKSLRVVLESLIERASDTTQVKDLETHHQLSDKLQELKVRPRFRPPGHWNVIRPFISLPLVCYYFLNGEIFFRTG